MAMLICNGILVDGTDRDPIARGAVLVEGTRIVAAGPEGAVTAPANARVIDAENGTIIPGLINLHSHISRRHLRAAAPGVSSRERKARLGAEPHYYQVLHSARNVLDELRAGVTTIVDYGMAGFTAIALRRAIDENLVPGPRLRVAGNPICITGGHSHRLVREADGPDEVRKAVREQIKAGADCIKLMGSGGLGSFPDEDPDIVEMTLDEMRAGVEEAHKFRKRTAVHAYPTEAIKIALRAGIDSVEHGVFLDEEAVAMMRAASTALVPTMTGLTEVAFQHRANGRHDLFQAIVERVLKPHMSGVRMAVEAGLRVGTGSDSGGEIVEEMELIQEASGLSNLDCLRGATRVSAEIAGIVTMTGTLEPGKHADLVVVGGQPLERLADLRKPRWVLRNGQLFEGAPMPLSARLQVLYAARAAN